MRQDGISVSSGIWRGRWDETRRGGVVPHIKRRLSKASLSKRNCAGATRRPDSWSNLGESGAAAVEFAFVTPILVLMLTGIIQFGAIFFIQNHMVSVARETARYVAVGDMNATQAADSTKSKLINWAGAFTVNVTEAGGDVSVDITIPLNKAAIFDIWGLFKNKTLKASSIMRKET